MPKLPRVSGREAVRVFQKAGWDVARQRGSHVVLIKSGSIYTLSIPLPSGSGTGTVA